MPGLLDEDEGLRKGDEVRGALALPSPVESADFLNLARGAGDGGR